MKLLRAKHLILTVTAMFSLFVSAVSACACSHHEPVKVEASSCHGPSHEVPPAESASDSPHFESDCNCFVRTPVPAIVAKNGDQKTSIEAAPDEKLELPSIPATEFETIDTSSPSFEPPQSNYQHALLSSLPSRAPPRL